MTNTPMAEIIEWHNKHINNFNAAKDLDPHNLRDRFVAIFLEYKQRYNPCLFITAIKDTILNYKTEGDEFNFLYILILDYGDSTTTM